MNAGPHGWDADGNCLWCGRREACRCDHGANVATMARMLALAPKMLTACMATMEYWTACAEAARGGAVPDSRRLQQLADKAASLVTEVLQEVLA